MHVEHEARYLLLRGSRRALESETLRQHAANDTKEQFANSPDLKTELLNAIMGALDAHALMSTQALDSPAVRDGMKDILLNDAGLDEKLRSQRASEPAGTSQPLTKL